jgi:integrase
MSITIRSTQRGEKRYLVKVSIGTAADGRRLEHRKTFRTLKAARHWEADRRAEATGGGWAEPSRERLGLYLTGWLDGTARLNVRPRTLDGYRAHLARYVQLHPIASVPLRDLAPPRLRAFYGELAARGLSARTVRLTHAILRAALEQAVDDRRLTANPAAGALKRMRLVAATRRDVQALTPAQVHALLATSERTGNRWHALWHLLVNGGLRPSEALALRWEDVGADRVHVRQALDTRSATGARTVADVKTHGSRRAVTLPAATMAALAWHRTRQEAERIAGGAAYADRGLVFAGQTGEPIDLKNATARHFVPLLAAAGLPRIRVYDLRHTHATLLLAAGVPVNVVSARLGHASAKMTLDVYGHVLSGQQEDAVRRMEAILAEAAGS